MIEKPIYNRPPRPPDLEVQIQYLTTEAGGRHKPVASGYRPNHDFGLPGETNDAQHEYPDVDWVQPGESVRALLWLLTPDLQAGRFFEGFEFTVQEGGRIVGRGRVLAVINESLQRRT